jgi:hypothetical protein
MRCLRPTSWRRLRLGGSASWRFPMDPRIRRAVCTTVLVRVGCLRARYDYDGTWRQRGGWWSRVYDCRNSDSDLYRPGDHRNNDRSHHPEPGYGDLCWLVSPPMCMMANSHSPLVRTSDGLHSAASGHGISALLLVGGLPGTTTSVLRGYRLVARDGHGQLIVLPASGLRLDERGAVPRHGVVGVHGRSARRRVRLDQLVSDPPMRVAFGSAAPSGNIRRARPVLRTRALGLSPAGLVFAGHHADAEIRSQSDDAWWGSWGPVTYDGCRPTFDYGRCGAQHCARRDVCLCRGMDSSRRAPWSYLCSLSWWWSA